MFSFLIHVLGGLVVSQSYFCCLPCKISSMIVKLIKDRMNGLTILLKKKIPLKLMLHVISSLPDVL